MRRALRVQDNTPLWNAIQDAEKVIPVVCLSDKPAYAIDTARRRFIAESLRDLQRALQKCGSGLYVVHGRADREIPAAAARLAADAVYAVNVYDPASRERDRKIGAELKKAGIEWQTFKDVVILEGDEIRTAAGLPFKVFTPYKRTWLDHFPQIPRPLPRITKIRTPAIKNAEAHLECVGQFAPGTDQGGETAARKRLKDFISHKIASYRETRDLPGIEGTSRLSAHLSHGTISIRDVFWSAIDAKNHADKRSREAIDTFISELIWREFYYQVLSNFPHVIEGSFREEFDSLVWSTNKKHFAAWCEGRTGYPVVDAAMRQLNNEGWMHNRARMIVASFLAKDLHLNWRWGEQYFLERLVDGDIASNNGGWQWAAGTGTDASPWFRIFNPVLQGEKFDPDGAYVHRYVPELRNLPSSVIHKPWLLKKAEQQHLGCLIGRTYPAPIVDHAAERKITLALYRNPGKHQPRLAIL